MAGRIVALVDVFDALVSDRCYKKAWSFDETLAYVKAQAGTQFDPTLVDLLMSHLDAVQEIYQRLPDRS